MSKQPAQRFTRTTKRPIDKKIIVVNKAMVTSTQTTDLLTATFPCTITGLRWDLMFWTEDTISDAEFIWGIYILREGGVKVVFVSSDGGTLFKPEENMMTFGFGSHADKDTGGGPTRQHFDGSTKSMRKLQGGDKLVFQFDPSNDTQNVLGAVQFFCKT